MNTFYVINRSPTKQGVAGLTVLPLSPTHGGVQQVTNEIYLCQDSLE